MFDTVQTPPSPASVFQAQYGAPPSGQDPRADCERWERLCGELLAERERLRADLERARFVEFCKEFQPLTTEELQAQIDQATPFEDIIGELKMEMEIPAMSEGLPHKVDKIPAVKAQMYEIGAVAKQTGKLSRLINPLEEAARRLQSEPAGWAIPSIEQSM